MSNYSYTGYNKSGSKVSSILEAKSEGEARTRLRMRGIKVLTLSGAGMKKVNKPGDIDLGALFSKIFKGSKKGKENTSNVNAVDLMIFTKQLATLIDAGIPIVGALAMIELQMTSANFKGIISYVRESIENGKDFAAALEKYPTAFDQTYVSLVRAGSSSGQLDTMMKKIATYTEKAQKLKKQLKSAMSYPTIVLIIAIVMTVSMLTFVVPMFAENYKGSGKSLPGLTQLVVDMSDGFKANFHYIIAASFAAFTSFSKWKKTNYGKKKVDTFLLHAPIFGPLVSKIAVARFSSTLATLVSSGIGLPEALKICSKAAGNVIVEKEILEIEGGVVKGRTLSEGMRKSFVFPEMVSGMVHVGESTGRLDAMLEKISDIYEEDVETTLAGALKMVEPIMFVLIGGIVGVILIAMYLPIFDMASTVQ